MTRKTVKLAAAVAFIACAFGGFAAGLAWATPPSPPPSFVSTPLAGPTLVGPFNVGVETPDWGIHFKTRGDSDVYMTHIKLAPGAHGGWHSHPGPSVIAVRAGTATFYAQCHDFVPQVFPAGTGFVERAGCVHLLANEGDVDLEVVVMQIVPRGAARRIDEANPLD